MDKADGAFLTIGELARDLGVAQHILRYWESRFSQLKPLQRSGNRRYYRPADVAVARRINQLLNEQGFTVRGAQRVLDGKSDSEEAQVKTAAAPRVQNVSVPSSSVSGSAVKSMVQSELMLDEARAAPRSRSAFDSSDLALLIARLTVIRETLADALD